MIELCDKAKEELEIALSEYPDAWKVHAHICAYNGVHKGNGSRVLASCRKGAACHGSLYSSNDEHIIVNAHSPHYQGKFPDFIKWVCQESPYSFGVINKDNDDQIVGQAAAIDVNLVGRGGCLWLCKAARYPREDDFRIPVWYQLREQGLNGLQAFIGCSILDMEGHPATYCTHNSLFGYSSPEGIRRFYDDLAKVVKRDNWHVSLNGMGGRNWGSIKHKTENRPDGWGGFVQIKVPVEAKDYAAALKEIFEGDPKNV